MSRRGLRRDYALAASGQLANALAGFVGVALLTRILGPTDFGLYVLVTTIVIVANVALVSGLQSGVLAVGAKDPRSYPSVHGLASVIGIVLLAGAFVATVMAERIQAALFPSLTPIDVATTAIRITATAYAGLIATMLAAVGRIGLMALLAITTAVTSLLAVVGAQVAADQLTGALAGASIGAVLTAGLALLLAVATLGIPSRPPARLVTSIFRIAVPMQLGAIGYWVLLRGDAFVLNSVVGGAIVGVYALALTISEKIGLITAPLYNSTAWRIAGTDKELAKDTTLRIARIEVAVGACAVIVTWFVGPLVVRILGGPGYEDAVLPLAILAFGAAVLPLWSTISLYLVSHLHLAWHASGIQICVAVAALVGYFAVVPRWGMTGAATVSTLAYVALVAVGLLIMRRDSRAAPQSASAEVVVTQRLGSEPWFESHASDIK